jgi:hypothetical protein
MGYKALICYGVVGAIGLVLIVVSMGGFFEDTIDKMTEDEVYKSLDFGDTESEGYKNFVSTLIIR